MYNEMICQIALTLVPQIGYVHARTLVEHFGNAASIFKAPTHSLEKIDGIGTARASAIRKFRDFAAAEKEIAFLNKHGIAARFIGTPGYPERLMNCYDPPTILYVHGKADLNASRVLSVVGTRSKSEYGKCVADKFIQDLAGHQVTIVSGMALGIDAVAHKAALRHALPTIGVLAHGLASMYPPEHAGLAKEIVKQQGALVTEFRSSIQPDKHHFPTRNRIVAGFCDAVLVIETGLKGGSMITAELANGYNRDVFAVPGKITDPKSSGCNLLIRQNKAILISEVGQLLDLLGWIDNLPVTKKAVKELFPELSENEIKIADIVAAHTNIHIDELRLKSGMTASAVAATILDLELKNIIRAMPGKTFVPV